MESGELDGSNDGIRVEETQSLEEPDAYIRLLKNVKYKIRGQETGKLYVFDGAGTILEVDSDDVDGLMENNENRPTSCCGDKKLGPIFELVE